MCYASEDLSKYVTLDYPTAEPILTSNTPCQIIRCNKASFVKVASERITLSNFVMEFFGRSSERNERSIARLRRCLRKQGRSLLGWLRVSSAGPEKAPNWVIKILIKAAGGILKRAADNRLETRPRAPQG